MRDPAAMTLPPGLLLWVGIPDLPSILFVCLGNIRRSPLAGAALRVDSAISTADGAVRRDIGERFINLPVPTCLLRPAIWLSNPKDYRFRTSPYR